MRFFRLGTFLLCDLCTKDGERGIYQTILRRVTLLPARPEYRLLHS